MTYLSPYQEDGSLHQILRWVRPTMRNKWIVYHSGDLAVDRLADPKVAHKADIVRIMAETQFVVLSQYRRPNHLGSVYTATQTGAQPRAQAVLSGVVSPTQWWALQALREPLHGLSATRAIRETMAQMDDRKAKDVLQQLIKCEWAEETADGTKLTAEGLRVSW